MPTRTGKIQIISPLARDRGLRQHLVSATQHIARVHKLPRGKILVVLGDDKGMRRLKRLFWKKNETSDVVSFSYPDNQDPAIEIYINRAQAKKQTDIVFLYIHGLLHTLGWDDKTPGQKKEMLELGQKILVKTYGSL